MTFEWSHGATTQNATGLSSGGYEVTITDGQGCTAIAGATVLIEDKQSPIARVRGPITLYLGPEGELELTAAQVDSGSFDNCGILNMQLEQSVYDCSDVGRNFIEFTVIDNNLNITTRDVEVTVVDTIAPYWECTDTVVVASCDGVVNYLVPRIVDNCPNGSVTVLSGLGSGAEFPLGTSTETYSYTSNGGDRVVCTIDVIVEKKISASVSANDVECPGDTDGSATVTIEDGAGQYSFNWSDGQSTQSAVNLSAGNYRVTVSDTSDCTFVKTVLVGEPVSLSVRLDSIKAPDGKGDIFMTPLGGTPPYQYRWMRGNEIISTVQDPKNLDFGVYNLLLIDGLGCQYDLFSVTVDLSTSIDESTPLNQLRLSPNPTAGPFDLVFPESVSSKDRKVEIRSLTGKLIYRRALSSQNEIRITPGHLADGLYLVSVHAGDDRTTRRLVVSNR